MNIKKNLGRSLILSIALLLTFGFSSAQAASVVPKIESFKEKTTASLKIVIKYSLYKKKEVDIKVKIKNKKTGKSEVRDFKKEDLNSSGEKTLLMENLTANTKYSFRVKLKKHSSDKYTGYSDSKSTKTKS